MQGSGKTLCYLVPLLNSICNAIDKGTFDSYSMSLILLPTRELAIQVESVLKNLLAHLRSHYEKVRIPIVTISGGFSIEKQIRLLASKPKIVIGTVGRVWDILQNGKSEDFRALSSLNYLILDEIDRILDLGQLKELSGILQYIENP
jgi:superfamily II DNA/RNA helicase